MIKQGTSLPFSIGLFFTILLQLMSTPVMGRDKTDVVILKNGDHVTGEIKSLDRGKLSLSTDSMGTVKIEWEDVERVTSQWIFEVETEAGVRTFGSLAPASEPRTMEIIGGSARNTLNQTSVVRMTQIEAGFWNRLEGYVDIGFNFSRANRATEWTFGSEVKTRSEIRQIRTTLSSFYNDRKDVESNTRNVLGFDYTRFFSYRWLVTGLTSFTQNQELNLDLRSVFGGDLGRHVIQNNRTLLTVRAGAVFTREEFAGSDPQKNIEGKGTIVYELFSFQDPEMDIVTTLTVLPSLTDWGRLRADLDTRVRFELFKDFFWSAPPLTTMTAVLPKETRETTLASTPR